MDRGVAADQRLVDLDLQPARIGVERGGVDAGVGVDPGEAEAGDPGPASASSRPGASNALKKRLVKTGSPAASRSSGGGSAPGVPATTSGAARRWGIGSVPSVRTWKTGSPAARASASAAAMLAIKVSRGGTRPGRAR